MATKRRFSLSIFRQPKRDSHSGHVLYLTVNFPLVFYWKIGIGYNAIKRAKQVDRAVFGIPIPVMVLFIPGAYYVEQALHQMFRRFNTRYYTGDGSSEWFWFPVAPIVCGMMLGGWMVYLAVFDVTFGTDFLPMALQFIVNLFL